MSFTITTVYPDGRREEREATAEEVAQYEADRQRFLDEKAAADAAAIEREQARESARNRLKDQGFTDSEIDIMYPSLIG